MGIKKIVEAVQKLLDSNNEQLLMQQDGLIIRSTSTVNSAAEEAAITKFEQQIGHQLPEDHRSFLLEYDGMNIYQFITDLGSNGGGGLEMFSVQEMKEHLDYMRAVPHFLPIGFVDQQYLGISLEAIKKKNPNYLFLLTNFDGPQALNLNFHLFLERFVIAQGIQFWEWPNSSAASHDYLDEE